MATKLIRDFAQNSDELITTITVTGGRLVEIYIHIFPTDTPQAINFTITGHGTTWTERTNTSSIEFDTPKMYSGVPATGGTGTITLSADNPCDTIQIEVIEHDATVLATDNGDNTYIQCNINRGGNSIELSSFSSVENLGFGWFGFVGGDDSQGTPATGLAEVDAPHTEWREVDFPGAWGFRNAITVSGIGVETVGVTWVPNAGFFSWCIASELETVPLPDGYEDLTSEISLSFNVSGNLFSDGYENLTSEISLNFDVYGELAPDPPSPVVTATKLFRDFAAYSTGFETESFTVTGGRLVEIYAFVFPVYPDSEPQAIDLVITGHGTTWTERTNTSSVEFDVPKLYSGVPTTGGTDTLTISAVDPSTLDPAECEYIMIEVIEHYSNILATDNGDNTYVQSTHVRGSSSISLSTFSDPNNICYAWFGVIGGSDSQATPGSPLEEVGAPHTEWREVDFPGSWGFRNAVLCAGLNDSSPSVTWTDDGFIRWGIASELVMTSVTEPGYEDLTSEISMSFNVSGDLVDNTYVPKNPYPLNVKQIHSGHSLTDPGFHPYPGPYRYMMTSLLGVPFSHIEKSTIPGSGISWRWNNDFGMDPSARYDIVDWELLIITEGIPIPNDGLDPPSITADSSAYLSLYVNNSWENGNDGYGAPTLLWTTWSNVDDTHGPFRQNLDEWELLWEEMADYANDNRLPGCPPVYFIPGHRMMMRFYDDIENEVTPEGIDDITDFFRDPIHLNDLGSYAYAMIHYACLYHLSPVGLPIDIWGTNDGWGDATVPETPEEPRIPTPEQALYIQQAVWDVVTTYERTGVVAQEPVYNERSPMLFFNF